MVDHRMLDLISDTKIEITSKCLHLHYDQHRNAPVIMKMKASETQRQPFTWRLNKNLLQDDKIVDILQKEIELYFVHNDTGETTDSTLWEAHKAYIRGILISIGAGKKKERLGKIESLTEEIHRLEQAHKKHKGHHQALFHQLINKREELKDILEQESRRTFKCLARDRYLWGNKSRKHLARVQKKKEKLILLKKSKIKKERWSIHLK